MFYDACRKRREDGRRAVYANRRREIKRHRTRINRRSDAYRFARMMFEATRLYDFAATAYAIARRRRRLAAPHQFIFLSMFVIDGHH